MPRKRKQSKQGKQTTITGNVTGNVLYDVAAFERLSRERGVPPPT